MLERRRGPADDDDLARARHRRRLPRLSDLEVFFFFFFFYLGERSVTSVNRNREIREFLATRRARITPGAGRACRCTAATAACPGCAARRSRCSPGSASTTTRGSNAATSPASPRASSTPWPRALQLDEAERTHLFDLARAANAAAGHPPAPPARSRVRPARAAGARRHDRARPWIRNGRADVARHQPARPRPVRTGVRRPGPPGEHRPVHLPRPARRGLLPRLGSAPPTTWSPCCAPKPAATPTTGD